VNAIFKMLLFFDFLGLVSRMNSLGFCIELLSVNDSFLYEELGEGVHLNGVGHEEFVEGDEVFIIDFLSHGSDGTFLL
jgi:hypothetical protein